MLSPGFVHAVSPEHGEPVVFTPGELLPPWVDAAIEDGARLVAGEGGVLTLERPPAKPARKGSRSRP